jgi:hypothetical protein
MRGRTNCGSGSGKGNANGCSDKTLDDASTAGFGVDKWI